MLYYIKVGEMMNNSQVLKPLKYPGLGLFMTFKAIFEIIEIIIKYALRGFGYIFIDIPVFLWKESSIKLEAIYKKNQTNISDKPKKKNIFNMDINDLLKNTSYMKKKNLEYERMKVLLQEELKNSDSKRSKEPIVYRFQARKNGKIENGTMSGYSKIDVNTFLVQEGYEVFRIDNNQLIDFLYGRKSVFAPKLKTKDLLFWLTQLSTYIKSGISLVESIKILNKQMNKKGAYKMAFQSIVYELTMGESFSSALEKQGTMFPPLLINMLKAAEATGRLVETLDDMANYYNEIDKTRRQMISAMMYPSIIFVFSIAVVSFILMYVIPQFMNLYTQSGTNMNALTLTIIRASDFLKENIFLLIFYITAIIIILNFTYRNVKAFRKATQVFFMKLPVIGKIIIYNEMTIFTKTFASLLANNVFITDSIDILSKITNNEVYKEIMYNTIENIVKGEKISVAFKDHWAIPDVAYYMIVTGESTGELATMMTKVSNYYQELHKNLINNLKAFIEPIMIAFLAMVVGGIILAVLLPMFDMMKSV